MAGSEGFVWSNEKIDNFLLGSIVEHFRPSPLAIWNDFEKLAQGPAKNGLNQLALRLIDYAVLEKKLDLIRSEVVGSMEGERAGLYASLQRVSDRILGDDDDISILGTASGHQGGDRPGAMDKSAELLAKRVDEAILEEKEREGLRGSLSWIVKHSNVEQLATTTMTSVDRGGPRADCAQALEGLLEGRKRSAARREAQAATSEHTR